jgi:hypothetical protein
MARHLIAIMVVIFSSVPIAARAQSYADWNGGDGNWSDASKWTCDKGSGSEPCVPNGSQFAVQINNGKVDVDIDVTALEVVSLGAGALSISAHSLSVQIISGLASVEMTNNAKISTELELGISGGSLTMQDSSIGGGVAAVINTAAPSTGTLRASGSSIQQLALRGSMQLSNSTVGATAGLFNAQYMTRMARIALMPPKAMRCRPSETL